MQSGVAQIKSLWESIEARAWNRMRAHFSQDAVMEWPVTGERFAGVDGIVAVNEKYPEGWAIHVLTIDEMSDGRVVSRVRVDHGESAFFAVSFFSLESGLIKRLEEFWATKEEPESWRDDRVLPGWSRIKESPS